MDKNINLENIGDTDCNQWLATSPTGAFLALGYDRSKVERDAAKELNATEQKKYNQFNFFNAEDDLKSMIMVQSNEIQFYIVAEEENH